MCGLAGISFGSSPSSRLIDQIISYRGTIRGGWHSKDLQMLVRRLPRTGNRSRPQPIVTEAGSVLGFNGQVYNASWMAHRLGVACDDAVIDSEILALWLEENGPLGLSEIDGEFAIAFFDRKRSQMVLARDQMGTRPLFWARAGQKVAFASSAKATSLLACGTVNIDLENASDCLWYGVPPSGSCFRGVRSVEAGTALICDQSATNTTRINPHSRVGSIDQSILAAVARRVPKKGASLAWSGGLDSEFIRRSWPKRRACKTAHLIGTPRSQPRRADVILQVSPRTLRSAFRRFSLFAERPVTSLSGPAMFTLAVAAKKSGSEVWLSGEGADELFAGYSHYFKESEGHPFLLAKQRSKELVEHALDINTEALPSEPIRAMLVSRSPIEWLSFDRNVRLPEHLCPMNSDIPTMMAEIESRSPYLDLWHLSDTMLPESPKKRLADAAEACGVIARIKEGLFFPSSLLGRNWLIQTARAIEGADTGIIRVPSDLSSRVLRLFAMLDELVVSKFVRKTFLEALASFIMGLSSFLDSRSLPTLSELDNFHTLISVCDGRVCSTSRSVAPGIMES